MRRKSKFIQSGCAGLHPGLACIHTPHVPHTRCEIMGPARRMSEQTIDQILNNGLSYDTPSTYRTAIRERMINFNEALWHAAARVAGKPCACAACSDPADPRHPWLITDPS